MPVGHWFTFIYCSILGGIMILAALKSQRNPQAQASFLQLYERGARRSLHPDVATRSATGNALGTGIGLIAGAILIFFPWPQGLLFFPPLWFPLFGCAIGYALAWRIVQTRTLKQARARGEVQADLSIRHPRRYIQWPYILSPWLLVCIWTILLVALLQPLVGQRINLGNFKTYEQTINLSWFDLLLAPAMGVVIACVGWLLMNFVALAPKVLPSENHEWGAHTDDVLRKEALSHLHIGILATLATLLMGPTALIPDQGLRWFLIALLIIVTMGLLSTPTLFQKALFGSRKTQQGENKEAGKAKER